MNLITLLTDFGTRDYFVGAMKGAVLSVNPEAAIVDITHHSPPHNIRAAAFTLFAAHSTFPKDTIHVCVVDPGVGSERRAILAITDNYLFVAPDNGVLSLIYAQEPNVRVFHITNDRFFRQPVSTTFHGRDIFAPVAGALSRGVLPAELGEETRDFVRFEVIKPRQLDEHTVQAEIVHIDHFGNCITNFRHEDLPTDFHAHNLTAEIGNQKISKMQNFFAQAVRDGELFMIFGSAGFLEIVVFQHSAAKLLKAEIGERVLLKRATG
ncbi:MAG: SAM-dependent chlorinase/fluorinase [Pyrinomonadaceae bacterium]